MCKFMYYQIRITTINIHIYNYLMQILCLYTFIFNILGQSRGPNYLNFPQKLKGEKMECFC